MAKKVLKVILERKSVFFTGAAGIDIGKDTTLAIQIISQLVEVFI